MFKSNTQRHRSAIKQYTLCESLFRFFLLSSTSRVLNTAEYWINVGFFCLSMFDVGGQRDERRKWIQCFNGRTWRLYFMPVPSHGQREPLTFGGFLLAVQMWRPSSLWWRAAATTWSSEKTITPTDYRKPSTSSRTSGTTGQSASPHHRNFICGRQRKKKGEEKRFWRENGIASHEELLKRPLLVLHEVVEARQKWGTSLRHSADNTTWYGSHTDSGLRDMMLPVSWTCWAPLLPNPAPELFPTIWDLMK